MKRIILIASTFVIASYGFAQSECSKSNAIFKTDNIGTPKDVYSLGSNPEFPFLRNLSTPQQVASAINKSKGKNGMNELNGMLMDIGFTNGVSDVDAATVSSDYIPSGTMGNMGDGNYNTAYIRLMGGDQGTKAWKVSSGSGCYMYFLAKCGNAFYPTSAKTTACLNVPLNLTGSTKEVTLESGGTKTTTQGTYVYYHRRRHMKQTLAPDFADIPDQNPSYPILLNTTKTVEAVPQSYTINLSTPDNNVTVCQDSTLNLTANIDVEKTSEYSGYYPAKSVKKYKEVSRHEYKKIARKMRKAKRKEEKVARLSHLEVNTDVAMNR